MMKQILGRNDPCWCGSGKKYKHCHLRIDRGSQRSAPTAGMQQIPLLRTEDERNGMRKAGKFNAQLMDYLRPFVVEGTLSDEIDRLAHEYTLDHGHTPACLGYQGYTKSTCISVNDVVCHGIPGPYRLTDGDIVNVDITTIVEGWYGDQSESFLIGEVSTEARRLVATTFECMYLGIDAVKPFGTVADIGNAISNHAEARGFSVVRKFQGHGLGRKFHQDPEIPHKPNFYARSTILEPGVCFTIEPMINQGGWHVVIDPDDGWTARTLDGKLSAQFEHTILLTESGPEILTLTKGGREPQFAN